MSCIFGLIFLFVCVCDFEKSCHSLVCWCFGADADSQPFPPFFFSSRRVGVCEEGRVVTRPPFFFCDRLVLYRFIEIEPRHFFFSLFAPFFFLSRRVFGLRRHWPPLQFAKFLFGCLFFPLRTWQPFFLLSLLGSSSDRFFIFSRSFI